MNAMALIADGSDEMLKAVRNEAGMTAMEAIKAGTSVAAELLQWNNAGTLIEGQLADIIAVSGNPLEDISTLENDEFEMIDGKTVRLPGSTPHLRGILDK